MIAIEFFHLRFSRVQAPVRTQITMGTFNTVSIQQAFYQQWLALMGIVQSEISRDQLKSTQFHQSLAQKTALLQTLASEQKRPALEKEMYDIRVEIQQLAQRIQRRSALWHSMNGTVQAAQSMIASRSTA